IGGLTLGVALHQAGIDATVYEAAPEIKPVGAGIMLGTNAMQVMQALGLEKEIIAAGQPVLNGGIADAKANILQNMPLSALEAHFGIGTQAIHRGRLQAILINALPKGKLVINKKAKSVINGIRPQVTFQDNTTIEADFLIGADGIHSVVRKAVFPQIKERYAGQTCWRGVIKKVLPAEKRAQIKEMWSKEGRFAAIQIAEDLVYWFAVQKTSANGKDNKETLHDDLMKTFGHFDMAKEIILATPKNQIMRNDLSDLEPTKVWHKGNIAFVGDAIHATTPNLGQGGAQAIEDGLALARCFEKFEGLENIFSEYERLRVKKANFIITQSRLFGRIAHWDNSLAISCRNFLLKNMPSKPLIKQYLKLYEVNY
ncbi:MAG: FAD-dependent monooxygenase, partial [Saprospiraceae bacterium]